MTAPTLWTDDDGYVAQGSGEDYRTLCSLPEYRETVAELRRRAKKAEDEGDRARRVLCMMGDHLAVERQSLDEYAGGRERRADALRAAADSLDRQAAGL